MALRVAAAMALAAVLRAVVLQFVPAEQLQQEIHGVASYLEVLGALYSIVVAFIIFVVWEQYNRVQIGIAQEAAALEDLCRTASFLSDRSGTMQVRHSVKRYLESSASDEHRGLADGKESAHAQERFAAVCQQVRGAPVASEKDAILYEELLRNLTRASDVRDERLSVSCARMPPALWNLVLFTSCALLGGFLLLGVHSFPLSAALVAAVAGCLAFLLSVVRDMDNPFAGEWNVSFKPMESAAARIGAG